MFLCHAYLRYDEIIGSLAILRVGKGMLDLEDTYESDCLVSAQNTVCDLDVERAVFVCVDELVDDGDVPAAASKLADLRKALHADVARVTTLSDGTARFVCEWLAPSDVLNGIADESLGGEPLATLESRFDDPACKLYKGAQALVADMGLKAHGITAELPAEHSDFERALEREIESRMREALESEEFVIHLQPKLDLRKDEIVGAEALVRWFDPRVGMRLPNAFVPLFEKNGFIVDLDLFVFEQVCALLHSWSVAGVNPVVLSVNLSRQHLLDPNFPEPFNEIRDLYGVSSFYIEFELSETLAFENPIAFIDLIDRIHRAGYACSIDHFGGGHSSINMLKDLEVDVLKLDKAFFGGSYVETGREADVVSTVIDLARRLNMRTVAEGVETPGQRKFLEEVGCDTIQGFLVSAPVPVPEFERMLFGTELTQR